MIRSDDLSELNAALSAAQGEFEAVAKTSDNPFFKSKFAPLPEVVKAATPILAGHGLAVWQGADTDEDGELLWTVVLHKSGQFIGSAARLLPIKNDPQAQGSAITYQRRYQFMSALGLVADDDDDGQAAVTAGNRSRSKPASRPKNAGRGNGRTQSADGRSGAQDAPQGDTVTKPTLEALAEAYNASGATREQMAAIKAELGAEGKKPNEMTEDQATWAIVKLRALGKTDTETAA